MECFASCAKGLEGLLEKELLALQIKDYKPTLAGISFDAELQDMYRVCLHSRIASRVLLPLFETEATSESLYDTSVLFDWAEHIQPGVTVAIDFQGQNDDIRNTNFGALRIKDALVDFFRARGVATPVLVSENPQARLSARLRRGKIQVALDLSGEGLHKRGYRQQQGAAPLRETLAAAMLMRAGWSEYVARQIESAQPIRLVDPMCGSGTLLIEAATMALNMAPNLHRQQWGFTHWPSHDAAVWQQVSDDAHQQVINSIDLQLFGGDQNPRMVDVALDNSDNAGLADYIRIEKRDIEQQHAAAFLFEQDALNTKGMLICNPPYGERLGDAEQLKQLYRALGLHLRTQCMGWEAAILTSNADLGREIGLHAKKRYRLDNGRIECQLLRFDITDDAFFDLNKKVEPSEGANMVANRLRKNLQRLKHWRKQSQACAFRVYDADMPEYSAAIDYYLTDKGPWLHIQEYQAPKTINPKKAQHRMNELLTAIDIVFSDIPTEQRVLKERARQKGTNQYQKQKETKEWLQVKEFPALLQVNLKDYLDTGLFLDHRPVRRMLRESAQGARFLNLFCYTATATVQAALGGAKETLSLDMSNTYLDWAEDNFALNDLDPDCHKLKRVDCLAWLEEASKKPEKRYDLIFMDPPSFSNSKKMESILDIQRDHAKLIRQASKLLEKDGLLVFSTNLRKFKMDTQALKPLVLENVSDASIDEDFKRNQRIHQCWLVSHPEDML